MSKNCFSVGGCKHLDFKPRDGEVITSVSGYIHMYAHKERRRFRRCGKHDEKHLFMACGSHGTRACSDYETGKKKVLKKDIVSDAEVFRSMNDNSVPGQCQ